MILMILFVFYINIYMQIYVYIYINTFSIQDHKNPFWIVDRLLMSISERGRQSQITLK